MKTPALILTLVACAAMNLTAESVLKEACKNDFLIGAALNQAIFSGQNLPASAIVQKQFNTISPEDVLKWEVIHPLPGTFDFAAADRYVAFGETNQMFVIGHTLVWHSQTPEWVFEDHGQPATREQLLQRMREHITAVVGRYRGRVKGWDVVNEALNEDGTLRQSPWLKIIGEDYLVKAYEFAHEADPAAELYYNDYSLEKNAKRNGAIALIKKLQAQGVPINGVGVQGHYRLESPSAGAVDQTIADLSKLGLKVMITELDVDVLPRATPADIADISLKIAPSNKLNPYTNGLPEAVQAQLAQRYADLFSVFHQHRDAISRVTFWGVTDADSWLNKWPVPGRTSYPLLFDRAGKPKPAFDAIMRTASAKAAVKLTQGEPAPAR